MTAHAAIKNTFWEDFSVRKWLTVIDIVDDKRTEKCGAVKMFKRLNFVHNSKSLSSKRKSFKETM